MNDPGVVTVGPSNILTNRSIANPPNAEAPMTPAAITTMASNNDGPGACRLAAVVFRASSGPSAGREDCRSSTRLAVVTSGVHSTSSTMIMGTTEQRALTTLCVPGWSVRYAPRRMPGAVSRSDLIRTNSRWPSSRCGHRREEPFLVLPVLRPSPTDDRSARGAASSAARRWAKRLLPTPTFPTIETRCTRPL